MRLLQIRHLGSLDPDSVPSHRSAARAGAQVPRLYGGMLQPLFTGGLQTDANLPNGLVEPPAENSKTNNLFEKGT